VRGVRDRWTQVGGTEFEVVSLTSREEPRDAVQNLALDVGIEFFIFKENPRQKGVCTSTIDMCFPCVLLIVRDV
jgi:hypothetical protein